MTTDHDAGVAGLRTHARRAHAKVLEQLRTAMGEIEAEIAANDGIYPANGGRLTQAELCRRAGIDKSTLQRDTHKTSTLPEVARWLTRVTTGTTTGARNIRRRVTNRATELLAAYNQVLATFALAELELSDAKATIAAQEATIAQLRDENAGLRDKVIPLPRRDR